MCVHAHTRMRDTLSKSGIWICEIKNSLSSGEFFIERVSPATTILTLPNQLQLEVRSAGNKLTWYRNGVALNSSSTALLLHWNEVYFVSQTTFKDLGLYRVDVEAGSERKSVYFTVLQLGTCILLMSP